ncbi:MAG TPA: hypothetical protein VI197_02365 [Polyangiaceae bacterium]
MASSGRMWTYRGAGGDRRRSSASFLSLGLCALLAACTPEPGPRAPDGPPPLQLEAGGSEPAPTSETKVDTHQLGASVFVVNHVEDFDAFMKFFEEGTAERASVGIRGQLLSKLDDGRVLVHFVGDDVEQVNSALKSEKLDSYLNRPGAPGASIVWLAYNELLTVPVTPPSGQTFSLLLKLPVNDFAAFKRGFEGRHAVFAEQSVIAEGLHQSAVDDAIAFLHFVGTDRPKLEALPKRPEFAELLAIAGYQGTLEPMVAVDVARSRPGAGPQPPPDPPASSATP